MLPAKLVDQPVLPDWKIGELLPAGTSRDRIEARLSEIDAALEPGGKPGVAVTVATLCDFAAGFGIKADPSRMAKLYETALGHFPLWAIETAVTAVLACWTNKFAVPMPGDIVEAVPRAVWRLKSEQIRLERALRAFDKGEVDDGGPYVDPAEASAMLTRLMNPEGAA